MGGNFTTEKEENEVKEENEIDDPTFQPLSMY